MEFLTSVWGALVGLYNSAVNGGFGGCAVVIVVGYLLHKQGHKMSGSPRHLRGYHQNDVFVVREDVPAVPGTSTGFIGSIISFLLKLTGALMLFTGVLALTTVLLHS